MLRKLMRYGLRLFLALSIFACLLFAVVLFAPEWLLLALGFKSEGQFDTFWESLNLENRNVGVPEIVLATQVLTLAPLNVSTTPITTTTPAGLIATGTQPDPTAIALLTQAALPAPSSTALLNNIVDTAVPSGEDEYFRLFVSSDTPPQTSIVAPFLPPIDLQESNSFANFYEVGEDFQGNPLGIIEYHESVFEDACAFWQDFCETSTYEITDIDFRSGGVVIYLGVPGLRDVGLAIALNDDLRTFTPVGIIMDDEVFAFPEEGELADAITRLVDNGNSALLDAQISIENITYHVEAVQFTEETMVIVLRN